jgi:DNA-binding CsgD family transcriptional regulator
MCVQSGRFSVHEMTTFIGAAAAASARRRFPRLRFAAEMSSVLPGPPAPQAFCEYEAAIIDLVERTSANLMFLYDLERFGTPMLMDVLKTHSRVLLDGAVLYNPTYLTPQHYLTSHRRTSGENDGHIVGRQAGAVVTTASDHSPPGDHQCTGLPQPQRRTMPTRDRPTTRRHDGWDTLTQAERRITGLVATGLTNRLIAEELTLSSHTVDAHLKHVYTKLDIHSRVELTVVALRHRLRPNAANPAPPNRSRR